MKNTNPDELHTFRMTVLRMKGVLSKLSLAEGHVYLALIDFISWGDHSCYHSVETLTKATPLKHRAVQYALGSLEKRGLIRRQMRNLKTSVYTLVLDVDAVLAGVGLPPLTPGELEKLTRTAIASWVGATNAPKQS